MKTEQEQIEKMARAMCGFCIVDKRCALKCCAPCSDVASCDCSYKENAKMLIDAGYGKTSEYKAEIKKLEEESSNICRVTAKEFATRICEMLWNLGVDASGNRFSYGDLTSKEVLYIAKQFGVGIDDCLCKENNIATSHINKLVEQDTDIKKLEQQVKQAQIDTINTIVKYCENPDHWRELKDCKLWGGKSDDLQNFLNGIFKEVDV